MNNPDKPLLINPFIFPSETNARFSLFLLSVFFLGIWIITFIPSLLPDTIAAYWENAYQAIGQNYDLSSPQILPELLQQIKAGAIIPVVIGVWLSVLWALIQFFYKKQVNEIIIDSKASQDPKNKAVTEQIKQLALQVDIAEPEVYLSPSKMSEEGLAFGFKGAQKIIIGGKIGLGLKMPHTRVRSIALILHELGHIANKDVYRSHLALALWKTLQWIVFPIIALLSFMNLLSGIINKADQGFDGEEIKRIVMINIPTVLREWVILGGLFIVFHLMYANILRVREYFADWRAGIWGARNVLIQIFQSSTPISRPYWVDQLKNQWRQSTAFLDFTQSAFKHWVQRYHPTPDQRRAALLNPNLLYKLHPELGVIVGFSLALAVLGVYPVLFTVLYFTKILCYGLILSAAQFKSQTILTLGYPFVLCLIYFTTAVILWKIGRIFFNSIGLQLTKDIIAHYSSHETYPKKKIVYVALYMTIGLEVGKWFTPLSEFNLQGWDVWAGVFLVSNLVIFLLNLAWMWFVYIIAKQSFMYAQEYIVKRYHYITFFSALLLMLFYAGFILLRSTIINQPLKSVATTGAIGVGVGLLLVIVFTGVALITMRLRFPRKSECAHCDSTVPAGTLLGKTCPHCHTPFGRALWLMEDDIKHVNMPPQS